MQHVAVSLSRFLVEGIPLALQWCGGTPTTKGPGSIPGRGTKNPASCVVWQKKIFF